MSTLSPQEFVADGRSVEQATQEDRLIFLRKTYSLVLLGVAIFALTISAVPQFPPLLKFTATIWGQSWWLGMIILLGGGFLVRVLARKPGIGLIGYLVWTFLLGTLLAIPVAMSDPNTVYTAAIMTALIFAGLTAYVFVTKKDFSFLGGILSIGLFSMIGIAICGMLFGFEVGVWFSWLGAALFSGYILYDTSRIMRTHDTREAVPAAIELFTSIVYLFWYILQILNSRD
jgi:FtsH-binding integral membrane protein